MIFAGAKICNCEALRSNRAMSTDKVIVALDYDDPATALSLVHQIRDYITFFKVGSQLFTRTGPEFIRELRSLNVQVFLDLKFHDIPATVGHAVLEAVKLDVRFLTIHTSGGSEMMKAAVQSVAGSQTTVLGVTVLTSMDDSALHEIGVTQTVSAQVLHLAQLAQQSGIRGLVCSPQEIALIRRKLGPEISLVTPGIRSTSDAKQDQKRTLSASEALNQGATHLVVGRPITQAPDPVEAARKLVEEVLRNKTPHTEKS